MAGIRKALLPRTKGKVDQPANVSNEPQPQEARQAFITITTMLGIMNRTRTFRNGDLGSADMTQRENRETQRQLSALATILVRDWEVVAAIVKPYTGSNLEVITGVHAELHHTQQPDSLTGRVFTWLHSNKNDPMPDDILNSSSDKPSIIEANPPPSCQNVGSLMKHIDDGDL
jgi:hypothetical protein